MGIGDFLKYYGLLALLVCAVIMFGCIGGAPEPAPAPTSTPVQQPTTAPANTPTTAPQATPTSPQQVDESDLAGLDLIGLSALGLPIECTFSSEEDGVKQEGVIKIHGASYRYDVEVEDESGSMSTVMVIKNDKVYMDAGLLLDAMGMESECDWIVEDQDEEDYGASGGDLGTSVSDYGWAETPAGELSCGFGTFSDSVFDTPGKICTTDEVIEDMMAATDPCASITDPAQQAACYQAIGGA